MSASDPKPPLRIGNFERLSSVLDDVIDNLEAEALAAARRRGRLRGPVKRGQRGASQAIDRLEAARQRLAEHGL